MAYIITCYALYMFSICIYYNMYDADRQAICLHSVHFVRCLVKFLNNILRINYKLRTLSIFNILKYSPSSSLL